MKRFIEGESRSQLTLIPECLEDYIGPNNPVRVVDAFVDALDLAEMGFAHLDQNQVTSETSILGCRQCSSVQGRFHTTSPLSRLVRKSPPLA